MNTSETEAEYADAKDQNLLHEWLVGNRQKPGLLKVMGVSIEEFARSMELSRTALYFFLQDRHRPSPDTLRRMCSKLGVSYEHGLKHVKPRLAHRPVEGPKTKNNRRRTVRKGQKRVEKG